ncbi:MAG: hypothetical protein ACOX4O_05275 [Eubacteriales bacterium]|jgi:ABC-type glycerol-3-phosphate transport system substrate-binding protein
MLKTKIISALLAALMLTSAALISACGKSETLPADDPGATEAETTAPETLSELEARAAVPDELPEADFGGYNYRIVCENDQSWYYYNEEQTGDVINDAVFLRNAAVGERFNFELTMANCSDYGANGSFMQKAVLAGDDAFDLACSHIVNISGLVLKDIFMNWYDIPHINFEKPWWSRSNIEDLTYSGVAILGIGDYALSAIGRTYCMFFNRQLAETYGIEGIYDTVMDGKWTIERLSELTKDIYQDLNSDEKRDVEDFYGFATGVNSNIGAYLWAFDNPICKKDGDGNISVVMATPKMSSIVETLNKIMWENQGTYYNKNHTSKIDNLGTHVGGRDLFIYGRTIFANGYLDQAIDFFRDIEDDYGIIPYPKWDENQTDYRSLVDGNHAALALPKTTQDLERAGIIMEALNAEGYKTVVPVYIETALKVKYARDNESVQVLDMLIANRFFDFGYAYDNWNGGSFWLEGLIQGNKNDWESHYAKNEKRMLKHYDKVFAYFDEVATG